ncbi:MAG: DMT family transporter [Clostridia bacterium]|nr:DMT family transporter [Clostridia bacterium]
MNTEKISAKTPIAIILGAIICNILFGTAVPTIKIGYELFGITDNMYEKILFAGIRFFTSGVLVWLFSAIKRKGFPAVPKDKIPWIGLHGFVYTFLQYAFMYVGLSFTSGAKTTIISATSAFVLIILSHFIYKNDKINGRKIIGSCIGFAGVIIALSGNIAGSEFSLIGDGLIFLTVIAFAIGSIIGKEITKTVDSFTMTAYNLLIGGGLLIIVAKLGGAGFENIGTGAILALSYLIMVSSVGFTLWATLLSKAKVGGLSVFTFVIPVSGTIFSALIAKEDVFTARCMASLALLCVGIIIVNLREKAKK